MIPGSNLLATALRLIRPVPVELFRVVGRAINSVGQDITEYDDPIQIQASVQAVKRTDYHRMGLDYAKRYIQLWSIEDISDLQRARSGDQIVWNNARYEVIDRDEWSAIDQWNSVMAVEIELQT